MSAMPGSPAIPNAIPMPFFGTTAFAAPGLGLIASAIMLGLGMLWLNRRVAQASASGEGYGQHEDNVPETTPEMREITQTEGFDLNELDGAAAGVHALMGGSMVALDGQQSVKVPGSFGALTDQRSAAFSRSGRDVASVAGPPNGGASLWIGPNGGQALRATDGRTLSRPSWALDDAVWVVVDGNSVVRVIREQASGQPARIPVDSAAVTSSFPGSITELQLSRDGTRAAMVIDGEAVLAGIEQTSGGDFALTYPRRIGFGLGDSVVSLSWRTGDDMVVTRNDPAHPVSYVNLDGVNSDGPGNNLVLPVSAVAANPSAVYVADARGVLQLLATTEPSGQSWSELRPFMVPGTVPVMPG